MCTCTCTCTHTLCISPVNPAATYHLPAHIYDLTCSFLVDTGAAVTLVNIHVSTWVHCKLSAEQDLMPWDQQRLVGVDGSPLQVKGSVSVPLNIGGHHFICPVVIVQGIKEEAAILGLDFLQNHQCVIDFQHHSLRFPERNTVVPLNHTIQANMIPSMAAAVLRETVVLPAYSELETLAVTSNLVRHTGTVWLLENNQKMNANITVTRAIVLPAEEVVVRLINPTNTPTTVYKNTKVATVSQLTDDHLVSAVEVHVHVTNSPTTLISNNKRKSLWETADHLSDTQQQQLYQLLLKYADVFPEHDNDIGHTTVTTHTIDTGSAPPIRQLTRKVPKHLQPEASKLINHMLQNNVIRKSASPWASPIVLVKKKDGSVRFCVDYCRVNGITRKDAYPLPRIDDTLSGSKWFTTLDLLSEYWQVEVATTDREKTAFVTRDGLYEFNVMPFGLCNAPATFQRLMDMVLSGLQWTSC